MLGPMPPESLGWLLVDEAGQALPQADVGAIASNGVRTIMVETANRLARDLIVQETGHRMLKGKGIEIIAAHSPGAFVDDTPTATFVRQVLGTVARLDKAMTRRQATWRARKRRENGWCEGGSA
jgi:DNA invertase Pin-like site-specific DNA recombinase